jgi:deoxyhypusine synthase
MVRDSFGKEASSWGKVETTYEQMVYAEATVAMPLIAGYAYQKGSWKERKAREFQKLFAKVETEV